MALQAQPHALTVASREAVTTSTIDIVYVALCAGIAAASFITQDPTRNDFERFGDLRLLFLFFGLYAGVCAAYVAAYAHRETISARRVWPITLLCVGLLLASSPVGSKDVFGYAFLGRMWGTLHANPYVTSPLELSNDPWFPSLVGTLRRPLSVYGPLFMWQSWVVNAVAGDSLWRAVWLHKAVAAAMLLVLLRLAQPIIARTTPPAQRTGVLLLLVWNPLFWFDAAGAAHNDIAMALLLIGALWCWGAERTSLALTCLALSFWYKWYTLIFFPAFLLETLKVSGARAALRQSLIFTGLVALSGAVLLAPLSGALPSITAQLLHPEKMSGIFPNELSPPLALLFWSLRAAGLFATDRGFDIFNITRLGAAAVLLLATLLRQWRATPSLAALVESCALIGLAFFMLVITQLWPWHLFTVVAVCILSGRELFLRVGVVLSVLALLSNFLTFAVATILLLLVVGAPWLMRRLGGDHAVAAASTP